MNIPATTKKIIIEFQCEELPPLRIGSMHDGRVLTSVVCDILDEDWKDSKSMKYAVRATYERVDP